jgi:hypothetical protein
VIRPIDPPDPAFDAFLSGRGFAPAGPPVRVCRARRGASWALYTVRRDGG